MDDATHGERMRLIQDNDDHWYVIPARMEAEFWKWVQAMEKCTPWKSDWTPEQVDGPHTVVFWSWHESL